MNQPVFAVTLANLRKEGACFPGYNKVVRMLQGKPFTDEDADRESYIKFACADLVPLADIARNNNLDDALWALRCTTGCDRDARLFAIWCAHQVEHLMEDERSKTALDVAERFANGEATENEFAAARAAARAAVWAADRAAARAAAWAAASAADRAADRDADRVAARAAVWAADRAAARAAARAAQLQMFIAMCEGRAPWQTHKQTQVA